MLVYPDQYRVLLTVPFLDKAGQAITPIKLRATLRDGEDELVRSFDEVSLPVGPVDYTYDIAPIYNALEAGERVMARVLRVELETVFGVHIQRLSYRIESDLDLEVMVNSFQTYDAAEIVALGLVNLTGWAGAGETQRKTALIAAFERICRLPFQIAPRDDQGNLLWSELSTIEPDQWGEVSADGFYAFPTHFKKVLRQAQVVEANELLVGDLVGARHRAGIVSETIGESSVTLRENRIDHGVSSLTLQVLGFYLNLGARIARA